SGAVGALPRAEGLRSSATVSKPPLRSDPPAAGLETIAPEGDPSTSGSPAALRRSPRNPAPHILTAAPHTVVVAGHAAGERAEQAARALGAPLLAEVSSGA